MSRRSAEQTRELLIDTALGMLHDQGPAAGVGHIRLSDVVDRAGLTTGAAYRLWEDQRAFHRELAIAAVRWRDRSSTERTMDHITPVIQSGGPWQEVIRRGSEANLQVFPEDVAFLVTLALRASAYGQPALVAASHERHLEAMAAYGELYAAMMQVYRRRFKPPFTLDHMCLAFAALSEGFGLQSASGEEHPRMCVADATTGVGAEWTLLGVTAVAIIESMTEPIDGSSAREPVS